MLPSIPNGDCKSSPVQCADGPIEFNILEAACPSTLYFFKFVLPRTTLAIAIHRPQNNNLGAGMYLGWRLPTAVSNLMY